MSFESAPKYWYYQLKSNLALNDREAWNLNPDKSMEIAR